jgi:hypothetical protein
VVCFFVRKNPIFKCYLDKFYPLKHGWAMRRSRPPGGPRIKFGWTAKAQQNSNIFVTTHSVALQSLKDLGRLTYRRFLKLFRHMVGLLGRVISPSQGLYLHRTTQNRKTRTDIHALSGIRNHDPSIWVIKAHAADCVVTVTGNVFGT